jgi:hypothetical protein
MGAAPNPGAREPCPWAIPLGTPASGATVLISSCLGRTSHFWVLRQFCGLLHRTGKPADYGHRRDSFYCRRPAPVAAHYDSLLPAQAADSPYPTTKSWHAATAIPQRRGTGSVQPVYQ